MGDIATAVDRRNLPARIVVDDDTKPMRFIRLKEVVNRVGLSKSSVYVKMNAGEFPESFRLWDGVTVWLESEVVDWMNQRLAERSKR